MKPNAAVQFLIGFLVDFFKGFQRAGPKSNIGLPDLSPLNQSIASKDRWHFLKYEYKNQELGSVPVWWFG